MPQYDTTMLITLDIGLAMLGLIVTCAGIWAILYQTQRNTREIATITRDVAFMIRRQYGDIDRDLQEIQELLRGQ
jgi:hypothetical protein